MGLNVYFCDVCGVRVTDVDLRSGHGMLRGHDVICATCLEMGHGKDWLASRGMPAEAAGQAATNGSAPHVPSSSAVLDHARDRAATVEDEVTQVRSAVDHEDTHSVRVQDADFAGAAAGFAALRAPERAPVDDADGALDEESSDVVDPALLKPSTDAVRATDEQPSVVSGEAADEDESSALVSVKDRGSSSKARSRSDRLRRSVSGARPGPAPAGKAPTKKTSSSAVQTPKSSGSGKISKPKSSATRSGRKPAGGIGGMSLPLKISLVTVPVLLILAAVMVGGGVVGRAPREADVKDMPAQKAQIEKSYKDTTAAINSAIGSKDLAVLKAAQASWYKLNDDFSAFEKNAMSYSGWTETNCETYRETLKMPDLGSRMKLIRDEIAKQSVGH